ncbi:MAG: glycosyltransferase family 4 protein [Eubacteriales bacterium]
MKILYFTDTYLPQINGVTNTLDKLGKYLDNNHIEYRIFAPYYNNDSVGLNENHVQRFKSIRLPAYPECRLSIPFYSNLCQLADSFKPDVIHLMTPAGLGLAGLRYAQEKSLPVVSSYTTSFDEYLKYYNLKFLNPLLWTLFRWFHNSCQINFCPSHDTLQILNAKGIENLKIWSRGIDTETFNPIHRSNALKSNLNIHDKITFLYVGRLAREKDLDIFMESIHIINKQFADDVKFVITGDGPYAVDLKKDAPKNVVFTGYITGKALSALYASCDIFAFPSSTETFGNVVLEAMASGLPVIGVNSGGVKDSIIDGYNGFLCTPRDTESFSQSIMRFIEDSTLINEMSVNAREYTLKKSWNNIFNGLTFEYHTLNKSFYLDTRLLA